MNKEDNSFKQLSEQYLAKIKAEDSVSLFGWTRVQIRKLIFLRGHVYNNDIKKKTLPAKKIWRDIQIAIDPDCILTRKVIKMKWYYLVQKYKILNKEGDENKRSKWHFYDDMNNVFKSQDALEETLEDESDLSIESCDDTTEKSFLEFNKPEASSTLPEYPDDSLEIPVNKTISKKPDLKMHLISPKRRKSETALEEKVLRCKMFKNSTDKFNGTPSPCKSSRKYVNYVKRRDKVLIEQNNRMLTMLHQQLLSKGCHLSFKDKVTVELSEDEEEL